MSETSVNEVKTSILQRAMDMFQRYGLRAMTMDDVCRELAMSKKTLYQHFANKADLVDQAVRHVFGLHQFSMDQIAAEHENAIDRMISRYAFLMRMMESHGPNMMFPLKKYYPKTYEWLFAQRQRTMVEALVQTIKDGQAQRLFREDLEPELVAQIHFTTMVGLADSDAVTENFSQRRALIWTAISLFIRSISTAQGLNYFNELKEPQQ
ncbi:MAG: TetR/AcrR family transcriptional regulator [Cryomorphaceae bacterium]|jgi:AcrR family transcriptional regulator|nr:TetR/AcrR family transcriptional regulator [Cryomorphaceae bacterium]